MIFFNQLLMHTFNYNSLFGFASKYLYKLIITYQQQQNFILFAMYSSPADYGYQNTTTAQTYTHNQAFSTMSKSRIVQANRYAPNQPLYDPLRNAVSDINRLQARKMQNLHAAKSSSITQQYRPLTANQFQQIRDNTYMIEKPLRPTDSLQKIQGKNFFVLDSGQKMGTPINQIQFRSRLAGSRQKQILVYDYEQTPPNKIRTASTNLKTANKQTYVPPFSPNIVERKKKSSKYNLYSCLDEPFERVKQYGCKNMKCAPNECIASKDPKDWEN